MSMKFWNIASTPWRLNKRTQYCQWPDTVVKAVFAWACGHLSISLGEVEGENKAGPH